MIFNYFLAILLSFLLTTVLVLVVIKIAKKYNITDHPDVSERKVHQKITPLLGGVAVFISMFVVIFIFKIFGLANFSQIPDNFLIGIFLASCMIMIGGILDDKYNLKPWQQLFWPILASIIVIVSGVEISYITNPIGGASNSIIYLMPTFSTVLVFFWLMGMMYTTKFLDGLDGLLSGVGAISALVIFLLSLDWDIPMSATSVWALILAGSTLGFLVYNWHPAKIFLGEGGSIFIGFMLGVLSIISGSKITTTLLVIGIPALDVFWVIVQRIVQGQSPFSHADNKHLHYQLLNFGLSQKQVVLFLYLVALIFGSIAVYVGSFGKLIAIVLMIVFMIILSLIIYLNKKIKCQK